MYKKSTQAILVGLVRDPESTVLGAVEFTLATIQQQFHTVGAILDEWDQMGTDAPTCWGMKVKGIKFIEKNLAVITAQLLQFKKKQNVVGAIDLLLTIPGLNTIKASFVAQLLGFEVGCIDGQNAKMYGINVAAFKITPKHTAKTRIAKIESYVTLCKSLGGAESLWDNWCELIALNQHRHFTDAEMVSDRHQELVLRYVTSRDSR